MISVGSDFSGVGSFIQALQRLDIKHNEIFACDIDKYARQTYCLNFGTEEDYQLSLQKEANPKDFSFYFPYDVYEREIPKEPLDIYMTSPPCQSFSLAGKRKGEDDKRGVLFYNSHEFIKKNKPRYFIFENVKGLLSDDNGKTFRKWLDYLGGKTINGGPVIFPHEESVPYHIYYKVLNAKNYGVPQNRERIFIVGIRDDADNTFTWAKPIPLKERLKDRLEKQADEKYFLSEKLIKGFINHEQKAKEKGAGFRFNVSCGNKVGSAITTRAGSRSDDNFIKIQNEIATCNDSIDMKGIYGGNRGNVVMKNMARTLDHNCNQAVIQLNPSKESGGQQPYKQNRVYDTDGISPVLDTECGRPAYLQKVGSLYENDSDAGRIYSPNGISCTIKSEGGGGGAKTGLYAIEQDTYIKGGLQKNAAKMKNISPCLTSAMGVGGGHIPLLMNYRVRRLTPAECFNLMDFNKNFKWEVSDTQAYKQAGNSIAVSCLVAIISKLNLS